MQIIDMFDEKFDIAIPRRILNDKRINASAKLLFGILYTEGRGVSALVRYDELAKQMGLSYRTIRSYLKDLEDCHYLKRWIVKDSDLRIIDLTPQEFG